jgi:MoxR-like ATPase
MRRFSGKNAPFTSKVTERSRFVEIQECLKQIYVDDKLIDYVSEIVYSTRNPSEYVPDMAEFIRYGASPRASLALIMCAKASALMKSKDYITPDDIRAVVLPVLRHRIILSYQGEALEISPDEIISKLIDSVKVP